MLIQIITYKNDLKKKIFCGVQSALISKLDKHIGTAANQSWFVDEFLFMGQSVTIRWGKNNTVV